MPAHSLAVLASDGARDMLFRGLAASGWHTAAMEITWPRPTRPDDVLRVESEMIDVVSAKTHPDRDMVTVRAETRTADGEVVQILTVKLVVPRRAAS